MLACFAIALRRAAKCASRIHHGVCGPVEVWSFGFCQLRAGWLQEFTLTSKFKDESVDQEVAASYKAAKYAIKASVSPAGKVSSLLLHSDYTITRWATRSGCYMHPHDVGGACFLSRAAAGGLSPTLLLHDAEWDG